MLPANNNFMNIYILPSNLFSQHSMSLDFVLYPIKLISLSSLFTVACETRRTFGSHLEKMPCYVTRHPSSASTFFQDIWYQKAKQNKNRPEIFSASLMILSASQGQRGIATFANKKLFMQQHISKRYEGKQI